MDQQTEQAPSTRHVIVTDEEYGLPYSKGLMASSIMATGLAPGRAFHVAEVIEERLRDNFSDAISQAELTCLALAVLREEVGESYAESYDKWHSVKGVDTPLVILLGGATGAGKSTIATMLASRLGITRVIPTDAIREVMRAMFSEELLPTLQSSSFDTSRVMRHPVPPDTDPIIAGFREQAAAVAVGIHALIRRAVEERTHLILEGAHIVPGFLELERFAGGAVVVPMVISVEDEELHRSHFVLRAHAATDRPSERYLEHFHEIRKLHRYVTSLAVEHGVPVVPSFNLDTTLSTVIDLVVSAAFGAMAERQPPRPQGLPNER
jgi:2-phosphoglycerate kinase